jgi:hypothetical protein
MAIPSAFSGVYNGLTLLGLALMGYATYKAFRREKAND